jgi:outer membrane protein OmpA-like peptidoglycan-associated protein
MGRSTSAIIVLLITLGWFGYSWHWYTCRLMDACNTEQTPPVEPNQPEREQEAVRYPLDFQWSNASAYTNSGFESFQQEILEGLSEENRLEIIGLYFEGESKPDSFENMGLARAEKIKSLFSPPIPEERILMRARLVNAPENAENSYFEAARFNWMEGERKSVEELDDRIIIRFEINSTERIYDPAVDEYLEKLANRIKETGEKVSLTGHTDNVGEAADNLRLGQRRAETVKDLLLSKGVSSEQVSVASKGESQPVATNATPEGKQDNRRVEVQLQKKQ